MKMWKVEDDDHNNNHDGQGTNCDRNSSFEPSAQVSLKVLGHAEVLHGWNKFGLGHRRHMVGILPIRGKTKNNQWYIHGAVNMK